MTAPTAQHQQGVHLLVGIPAAGALVTAGLMQSMLALQEYAARRRWTLEVAARPDGLVTRTRNAFASSVVHRPQVTHLLMLDADIAVEPDHIGRLVDSGHAVVGACVPLREVLWPRVREHLDADPLATTEDLRSISHSFAVEFAPGASARVVDDFAPATALGSAAMLIRRSALQTLAESDLVTRYERGGALSQHDPQHGWTFFDPMVDHESGTYLSEDYAFCARWRAAGGTIWADLRSRITHSGPVDVEGSFSDTLRAVHRGRSRGDSHT